MPPRTQFAKSGNVNIAYQVVGDGPIDLIAVCGWTSHLDGCWEEPRFARFLRRLASFSRLILFDKRGTGLSDPVPVNELPTLEQRMDDVRAVMDAVGVERASLLGASEGGTMCALFAATYPERTTSLVMYAAYARRLWAPDHPWAPTQEEAEAWFAEIEREWGGPVGLDRRAPDMVNDPAFSAWWARYLRMSASPGAAVALTRMNAEIDVRHVLPAIRVPTLLIHRTGDRTSPIEDGRLMAERIPNARLLELPGNEHFPFLGSHGEMMMAEIQHFLTGVRPVPEADRVLATVVATEILDVAATASRLGDRRWGEARSAYDQIAREAFQRFRGREAARSLDGALATFDGPARAVRCAEEIVSAAARIGLSTRAGLHTGEVTIMDEGVDGVAAHLASHVASLGGPGEVVVSNTVRDLVAGSGLTFDPIGDRVFPGLPGEWRLYRLSDGTSPAPVVPRIETRPVAPAPASPLSRREREVASLLAQGLANREIANELCIAPTTVERHVANILSKLGYRSRAQIAAWAVEHGLVRVSDGALPGRGV